MQNAAERRPDPPTVADAAPPMTPRLDQPRLRGLLASPARGPDRPWTPLAARSFCLTNRL